jgi:hypothetical protein
MSTSTPPDFAALRAARNAAIEAEMQRQAQDWGVPLQSMLCSFNPAACYCACTSGGPCEHDWDGEPYDDQDSGLWSATCSKCGTLAMSHSLRTAP